MEVLKTIREILICILLGILVFIGIETTLTVQSFRATMRDLSATAAVLPGLVDKQADGLRSDIRYEVQLARIDAIGQIDLARRQLAEQLDATGAALELHAQVLDQQIRETGGTIVGTLAVAGGTIQGVNETSKRVSETMGHFSEISGRLDETADLLLDCESNPDCFANRFIGTTQAIERFAQSGERAMKAVDGAMPSVVADVEMSTAASVEASKSTAGLMKNLEKQSRPLPLMVRFMPQAVQAILLGIGVLK